MRLANNLANNNQSFQKLVSISDNMQHVIIRADKYCNDQERKAMRSNVPSALRLIDNNSKNLQVRLSYDSNANLDEGEGSTYAYVVLENAENGEKIKERVKDGDVVAALQNINFSIPKLFTPSAETYYAKCFSQYCLDDKTTQSYEA